MIPPEGWHRVTNYPEIQVGQRCPLPPFESTQPEAFKNWENGITLLSQQTERPREVIETFIKTITALENPHLWPEFFLELFIDLTAEYEDVRNGSFILPEIEYYLNEDSLFF